MNATIEFLEDTELEVIDWFDDENDNIGESHNEVFHKGELIDVTIIEDDNPEYVDLQFGDGSLASSVQSKSFKEVFDTVTCSICHKTCDRSTAHLHQEDWIGECCWDDRLTKTQKEFLNSITDNDPQTQNGWWSCESYELRTAQSLVKKGLIEFLDIPNKGEPFEVRKIARDVTLKR